MTSEVDSREVALENMATNASLIDENENASLIDGVEKGVEMQPAQNGNVGSSATSASATPAPNAPVVVGKKTPPTVMETIAAQIGENLNKTPWEKYVLDNLNVGTMSNVATFCVMFLGLILVAAFPDDNQGTFPYYVLAAGLFGAAGSFTNWVAIVMLFDKVPLLYGSGVIPRQFKQIRQTLKDLILATFFEPVFLQEFLDTKIDAMMAGLNLEERIAKALDSPVVGQMIETKLSELADKPEGLFLAMMGVDPAQLAPLVRPFVLSMGSDIAPMLLESFNAKDMVNAQKIRDEADSLMTARLHELSPDVVKLIMEKVIREQLGWLILWGGVFGGALGIISKALGY